MTTSNTLDDLVNPQSSDEVLTALLTNLASLDFPTTSWLEGDPLLTILELEALSLADLQQLIRLIANGGYLDTATGDWLDILATFFALTRKQPTFAVVNARLTCDGTSGPYTITPGQLWFVKGNLRYNSTNTTNESLPTSSTLDLEFKAEFVGSDYNIDLGDTIALVTPLSGVTIEPYETDPSSGTCMVSVGTNKERDSALIARCKSKWGSIGLVKTDDAFVFMCTSIAEFGLEGEQYALENPSVNTVTKVLVDSTNPDGPGTFRIYLASDNDTVSGSVVTLIDDFVQPRINECAELTTYAAIVDTVTIEAVVYCEASKVEAAKSTIDDSLQQLEQDLDIGDGISKGKVYYSKIIDLLMSPSGVVDVPISSALLNGANANVLPAKGHITNFDYTIDTTITFIEV